MDIPHAVIDSLLRPTETSQPSHPSPAESDRSRQTETRSTALPNAWVERLFGRLSAMYGNRFATMWAGVDPVMVKETWADALSGFSADEIATGLRACMGNDWPPTLPEFMKACRRPPDYESMYVRAAHGTFDSDVAYWAAQAFGFFELRNTPWASAKARWIRCVDSTREIADLPAMPEHRRHALPAPGKTYTPEKARAAVDEINEILKRRPLLDVESDDDGEGCEA